MHKPPGDDLVYQVALLESFCAANGWSCEFALSELVGANGLEPPTSAV